ncbi:MAG: YggT family protein [Epsilonproteobacteria bacterium]|nr:YggT family protein [Campylobacterota bacterium]
MIINSILGLIITLLNIYSWLVIIAALLSFVNPDPRNQIVQFIRSLTEPLFEFVRRKMPFVVVNGIDLSPIVIIFGLNIIIAILQSLMI